MYGEAILDTLKITLVSTLLAYLIGIPLGVLLYVTSKDSIMPNPHVNTVVLVRHGLVKNGREQTVAGFHVYPADWFNPLDSATGELAKSENTVSIHWYSMSWIPKWKQRRVIVLRRVRKLLKKLGLRR